MSISERDIKILDFMVKQDRGTPTKEDWEEMEEIQKDNPNWKSYKEIFKDVEIDGKEQKE